MENVGYDDVRVPRKRPENEQRANYRWRGEGWRGEEMGGVGGAGNSLGELCVVGLP